jgi:hypothetical protein
MTAAAGGEEALKRHRTAVSDAIKTYDNQGVVAQLHAMAAAPASRMEDERWSAAGRNVGEVRQYFNGARGGQDVSFQGNAPNDSDQDRKSRIAYSMHPIGELRTLCKSLDVTGYDHVSQEAAYVLTCAPAGGEPVKFFVSTSSARLLRREFKDEMDDYGDYRNVDGELVPFVTVTVDGSGTATTHVTATAFNVSVPPGTFDPWPPRLAREGNPAL